MIRLALTLALSITGTFNAYADTLLMDAVSAAPPNSAEGIPRPGNGISMSAVQAQFGEPNSRHDAVGTPPISRWVYPSYTVYFEHDRVISSVIHR